MNKYNTLPLLLCYKGAMYLYLCVQLHCQERWEERRIINTKFQSSSQFRCLASFLGYLLPALQPTDPSSSCGTGADLKGSTYCPFVFGTVPPNSQKRSCFDIGWTHGIMGWTDVHSKTIRWSVMRPLERGLKILFIYFGVIKIPSMEFDNYHGSFLFFFFDVG